MKIDIDQIKENYDLPTGYNLYYYLSDIFKDLSSYSCSSTREKIIDKIIFITYTSLPFYIGEKLFNAFCTDKLPYITKSEFICGMTTLINGDLDELIILVFKVLDIDNDGLIAKIDIEIICNFIIYYSNKDVKSDNNCLNIIDEFMNNKNFLNLKEFEFSIKHVNSDIFILVLIFFYENKPFSYKNLEFYCDKTENLTLENSLKSSLMHLKPDYDNSPYSNKNLLVSPSIVAKKVTKSLLNIKISDFLDLDTSQVLLSECDEVNSELNEVFSIKVPQTNNYRFFSLDDPSKKISINLNSKEIQAQNNVESIAFKKSISFLLSLNKNEKNSNFKNAKHTNFNFLNEKGTLSNKSSSLLKITKPNLNVFDYEDKLYKQSSDKKMKMYHVALINKDMFYFTSNKKKELKGLHNLSHCFVEKGENLTFNDKIYYSFNLHFKTKIRIFYCLSNEARESWVKFFMKQLNQKNIFDDYSFINDLGEGSFGKVKLGINLKSKLKYAIKIINKEDLSKSKLENIKIEIEIMKICQHPNIVKFEDHYEDINNIYIVCEYLRGGNLSSYLINQGYLLTENQIKEIAKQIGQGLTYLHNKGIIHRDIKPDNIIICNKNKHPVFKIIDFGLSKISGCNEKVNDMNGTLAFSAPEVISKEFYSNKIDIWSMGVILFYLCSGTLPFDDINNDTNKVVNKILNKNINLHIYKCGKVSKECLSLIEGCLNKKPENRLDIYQFTNSLWLKE